MKNEILWNEYVEKNNDPYGKACIDVAREVMILLDNDKTALKKGYYPDIHTAHGMICEVDKKIKAGGITGFMADCVSLMIRDCHERGEEFMKSYK